ncbi:hypothetical protein KR200_009337 [Drosophila serrata]|nr:hypothetical protein KR200_009337 [Drosophila serrata]
MAAAHSHHNANLLSSDISRRNPQDEYELIQKIGSGTYGDVYKPVQHLNVTIHLAPNVSSAKRIEAKSVGGGAEIPVATMRFL